MRNFMRSIDSELQKNITVKENNNNKTYNSLLDMSSDERMEYVITSINSCDESNMTAEQYAMVRASLKKMMIQNALNYQKD